MIEEATSRRGGFVQVIGDLLDAVAGVAQNRLQHIRDEVHGEKVRLIEIFILALATIAFATLALAILTFGILVFTWGSGLYISIPFLALAYGMCAYVTGRKLNERLNQISIPGSVQRRESDRPFL